MQWDIFCRVIDNFGDIGVSWRLACNLADRGEQVRLWVDDPTALQWMAPAGNKGVDIYPLARIDPLPSFDSLAHLSTPHAPIFTPRADVLLETFGCGIPDLFLDFYNHNTPQHERSDGASDQKSPVWINLEYLSAENYVERSHQLGSPIQHGTGMGMYRWFFFPGFSTATGGLLRETNLSQRQASFDPTTWLNQWNCDPSKSLPISLFCYEPRALRSWLAQLPRLNLAQPHRTPHLLVTAGRAAAAVQEAMTRNLVASKPHATPSPIPTPISYLPYLTQPDFDHLLWSCALNFVRGEDSVLRAIWAGKPFVWHIYPQYDNAHHDKLDAFLDTIQAPTSLREFHLIWNDLKTADLPIPELAEWENSIHKARQYLAKQPELTQQLIQFAAEKS